VSMVSVRTGGLTALRAAALIGRPRTWRADCRCHRAPGPRQHHRQLLLRHRHRAARAAMDDRNGAAPVALREMPQSRRRYCTRLLPRPFCSSAAAMASTADWKVRPENCAEFTRDCRLARRLGSRARAPPGRRRWRSAPRWTTGRAFLSANSKSRSSCAGTPMTAPSP